MEGRVDNDVHARIKFFIPVFHINAHKADCLSLYHPKNNSSLGELDGETVERLWSQLNVFSHTTRNMCKANRIEQLEDAVTYLRNNILSRMLRTLLSKEKKIRKVVSVLQSEGLPSVEPLPSKEEDLSPLDVAMAELAFNKNLLKGNRIEGSLYIYILPSIQ
jgi:hypothetical protein